jgi:endonuclease III related protein
MTPQNLRTIYSVLLKHFGHRGWWPADSPFEIIIGAILTQNTNWKNVEKAIANLKSAHALSYKKIHAMPQPELAALIRPSGYYNQKSLKLKAFTTFLEQTFQGSIARMFRAPTQLLREQLLSIKGIGPETADSILLYAGEKPVFVVDLYTYRLVTRHGWLPEKTDYQEMQYFFQDRLPVDVNLYNDFHAQIVAVGNHYCKRTPQCEQCPLQKFLPK